MKTGQVAKGWLLLALFGAVLNAQPAQSRSRGLFPVPAPDLTNLEESVREHLQSSWDLIEKASADESLSAGALAQIFGEAGIVYHSYHLSAAAEACYRNARQQNPTDYRWHHYLGILYHEVGKVELAEHSFELAQALDPTDAAAHLWRASLMLDQERIDEAEIELRKAIEALGESGASRLGLGRVAQARRDFRAAVEHFEEALKLVPLADSLHYLIGQAYRELGDLETARDHLAQAGSVGVKIPDPLLEELEARTKGEVVHLLRGRQAFSSGDVESARAEFQRAVEAAPDSSRARVNLAAALARLQLLPEARDQLEQALRLDPDNKTAKFNLAQLAFFNQEFETTVNLMLPYVTDIHDDVPAVTLLANALLALNRNEEALRYFQAANSMAPADETIRLRVTELLLAKKAYPETLELLRQANQAFPEQAGTTSLLAQMLAFSPQLELRDGQEAYRLALKLYQSDSQPSRAELVALALAEMGRCESALRWQKTAISLAQKQPGNEALLERLNAGATYFENNRPCRPQ